MASDRYNAIKRKLAAQNIPSASQQTEESKPAAERSERFEKIREKLSSGGFSTSMTANDVDRFFTDSQSFMVQSANAYSRLTWDLGTSEEYKTKRKETSEELTARAAQVRTYLNANKSDIDPETYESYMQYLTDFSEFQTQSALDFEKKYSSYGEFESQEAYDQAVKEGIQQAEWLQKYADMSASKLEAVAAGLSDGEEKNWVLALAAQTPKTKEELQQELIWLKGQYEYLCQMRNESRELAQLKSNMDANVPDAPGYAEQKKQYEDMLKQYPSMSIFENLDYRIGITEKEIWRLEKGLKYASLRDNPDYESKSVKIADYINNSDEALLLNDMDDDELADYYYLLNTSGYAAAQEYYDYKERTLKSRHNAKLAKEEAEFASNNPVLASVSSIAYSLGSGAEYLVDVMDYGIEKASGNKNAELDYNQSALKSSTIRRTVSEQTNWMIGNWDAFDFVYNTVMSGVDSVAAASLFGGFGGIALGLSAAAQGTNDALERGMDSGRAFWSGLFSGVFECVFETLSIGKFNSLKEVAPKTIKDIFKNLGKSMLVNASEEMLTEIANIGYDTLVNGEFANYALEELKNGAWKDVLWQVLESGASGALMGMGMGSIASSSAYAKQQYQYYKTGKTIKKNGGTDALMDLAYEVANRSTGDMQEALNKQIGKVNKKATSTRVGKLYNTVNTANNQSNASANKSDIAKSLMRNNFSEQKANDIAEALVSHYNGQELTNAQNKLLRSVSNNEAVQNAISNIMDNTKSTMGQRSQNVRDFQKDVAIGRIARETGISTETVKAILNDDLTDTVENSTESSYEVSADGKAIDNNGNAINIVGVDSIKDGKMILKTDSGTISSDKVSYATEADALIYEAVAQTGASPASAWTMIKAFKETDGVSAREYATAVPLAYLYGKLNYKKGVFLDGKPRLALTEQQSAIAFQMGRDDAALPKATEQESAKSATSDKNADKKIIFEGFEYSKKKANKVQRASMEAIDLISKISNLEIHVYKSYKKNGKFHALINGKERVAPNGYFTDGNKIYIDINAGNMGGGLMLYALSHEIGHYIARYSAQDFKSISDFLFEHYGENVPVYKLLEHQKDKLKKRYKEDGKPIPGKDQLEREAQEELVCDMLSRMLADKNAYDKLMEFKQKDLNGFQKLGQAIKNILDKIVKSIGVYKTQNPDFLYAASVENIGEDAFRQLQDLYIKAFVNADANYQAHQTSTEEQADRDLEEMKFSDREYGGIREVLAKKGLDDLSKKYGAYFPLSASFDATMKNDENTLSMQTVLANSVQGKGSPFVVGRKAFIATYGSKTSVHIKQMGIDVDLYADVANESISKAIGQPNEQSSLDVIPHIREILSDSILMGVERIVHTHNKGTALYGYRMYSLYWYNDGKVKKPQALACTVVQDLKKAEGYVFQNIENVTIDRGLPGEKSGMSSSVNDDTYTVAQLYRAVKKIARSDGGLLYTAAEKDKYLFSYKERNDGVKYSDRDTESVSNRSLLANAFEGLTQNEIEKQKLQEYKDKIALMDAEEQKLTELNAKIKELSFAKGPRDTKTIRTLRDEAVKIANRINIYDKQLLRLEASKPLQAVLDREKKKAYKRAEQKGREALAAYKAKAEAKQRKIVESYQETRKKGIESRKRTEMRHQLRRDVKDIYKLYNRGKGTNNVKEEMKEFVSNALCSAELLLDDLYADDEMIRQGLGIKLSPKEKALLDKAKKILYRLDNPPEVSSVAQLDEWNRREQKLKLELSKTKTQLQEAFLEARWQQKGDILSMVMQDLCDAYKELANSKKSYIRNAFHPFALMHLEGVRENLKATRVEDMTLDQLTELHEAYTMVLTSIRVANKSFCANQSIEYMAKQLISEFGGERLSKSKIKNIARNLSDAVGWNYEKLYYALERINSPTFTQLFVNLANAENIIMEDVADAKDYLIKTIKKYGFKKWSINKKVDQEFVDNLGHSFQLTLGEIMLLYAYTRRGNVWKQLEIGGFVLEKKGLFDNRNATAYKLTPAQCQSITNTLTEKQKHFVEDMQRYLSDVMGEKGNEVSMKLWGVKLYNDPNYCPIRIAKEYKARAAEATEKNEAGFASLAHACFTNVKNKDATATICLDSFMDIWVDHVNEMSRYHGAVPALEDIRRVMNYSDYSDGTKDSVSVKAMMENKFGKNAVRYFENLYREVNSGAILDKLQEEKVYRKLLSALRKHSVVYSTSVLIQQKASLIRAYALIDRKYFAGVRGVGVLPVGTVKMISDKWTKVEAKAYAEMMKYAPGVTLAKEIGGFDVNGGSIRSYLMDTEKTLWQEMRTGTVGEKVKAIMKAVDDNAIANLPNVEDKIAWIEIWNACKRETADKYKTLTCDSEAFLKRVGDRFTEIIRATQVYDSVFAKSPLLKSKSVAVQYAVSFMNEANVVANMAESAMRDLAAGNVAKATRKVGALIQSIILTNLLKNIIYAMRDDDEDETFIEKYVENLVSGLLNDINTLNYIPIVRDMWSVAQGYNNVERPDMALIADAISSLMKVFENGMKDTSGMTEKELLEWDKKTTKANWEFAEAVAAGFGIPVKNIRREINSIINTCETVSNNMGLTSWTSIKNAALEGVADAAPSFLKKKIRNSSTDIYRAIRNGDTAFETRLKSTYIDDDGKFDKSAYHEAIREGLRNNDPRIKKAAQARLNGDHTTANDLLNEIASEGIFPRADIDAAIKSEYNHLKDD